MIEIFDDVVKEMDEKTSKERNVKNIGKLMKVFDKRIDNSVGAVSLEKVYKKYCDKDGKGFQKGPTEEVTQWDVNIGDGSIFTCDTQFQAQVLSILAQINERLKRVEKKVKERAERSSTKS